MDQPVAEPKPPTPAEPTPPTAEHGGRSNSVSKGLEPTRFGDWEKDGRCIDF